MTILAIETSCDETSVAIVRDGRILSNVVSSQVSLHSEYGGVVPELATREHLRNFLPVAHSALAEAKIEPRDIGAVAATQGPGLPNARAELDHEVIGSTLDDAAGECFDKVGKLIGLPYPGGPELDRLAVEGNPFAYDFPRPLLRDQTDDFSFAGLKTSVRYFLQKNPELLSDAQSVRDVCASVQAAIVEVLVTKTIRAARRVGVNVVTASG